MSLLDYVLTEEEKIEEKLAACRRIKYHPFFKSFSEDDTLSSELPASSRSVNVNPQIYEHYLHSILPRETDTCAESRQADNRWWMQNACPRGMMTIMWRRC